MPGDALSQIMYSSNLLPPSKGRSSPFPHSSQTGDLHITIHICDLCFLLVLRHRYTEGISDVVRVEPRPGIDLYNLAVLIQLLLALLRLLVKDLGNIEVKDIESLSFKLDLISQYLISTLAAPPQLFKKRSRKFRAAHPSTLSLIGSRHTPAQGMLVVLITFRNGEETKILVIQQLDIDYALKVIDAGCIESDVTVPDHNCWIAQTGKELFTDDLTTVRVKSPLDFQASLLFLGNNNLLLAHAVFFHPSMIVSASFIKATSLSAVMMFISSSSFAGRRTSQSPA